MTARAQPIQTPLASGIEHSSDAAGSGAGLAHHLELLVLDHVHSWGWDDILFVQCGDGWAAEEAWRRRRTRGHVVALDTSSGAIERARRLRGVAGRVEFATWDGRRLCQPDGMFDQLIASFAYRHSPDPAALAREMLRVLRPRGELYALEPESSAGEIQSLVTSAGFSEVEELATCHHEMHAGAARESAVVIHARARPFE